MPFNNRSIYVIKDTLDWYPQMNVFIVFLTCNDNALYYSK